MENKNFLLFGAILGVALIAAAAVVSVTIYNVRALQDTIAVTGSAKEQVISDTVKWVGVFTRNIPYASLRSGYASMKADEAIVRTFLTDGGVPDVEIKVNPVTLDDYGKYNPQAPQEYSLSQTVEVNSKNIEVVSKLAKNLDPVVSKGVVFSTRSLEYYYSKLPDLRVSLLSKAVEDAKARAEKIVETTGRSVGTIQSAAAGVVQVLPVNSVDISDYGNYDNSSIEKEVMVTVKVAFRLQ
jgi:uncharacterized protein